MAVLRHLCLTSAALHNIQICSAGRSGAAPASARVTTRFGSVSAAGGTGPAPQLATRHQLGCSAFQLRRRRSPFSGAANAAVELQAEAWGRALTAAAAETLAQAAGDTLECTVDGLPRDVAEALSDALLETGATSAALQLCQEDGAEEQEIFAENDDSVFGGRRQLWDRCTLVAHFAPGSDPAAALEAAAAVAGLDSAPDCRVEAVASGGWEQAVLDSYQPSCVVPEDGSGSGSLWVVPSWAAPPPPPATSVLMEPGVAFGTGEHPTTRLCLRWLWQRRQQLQGASVMDYGGGSGVLALTALQLGARGAVATDVDPVAVDAAAANGALNSFGGADGGFASLLCDRSLEAPEPLAAAGTPESQRRFDLVIANILAGPLTQLAPRLAGYAKPGALLALSGVLAGDQADRVAAAYAQHFDGVRTEAVQDGWALITGTRRA